MARNDGGVQEDGRISTGCAGLDNILGGGLDRDRLYLPHLVAAVLPETEETEAPQMKARRNLSVPRLRQPAALSVR
jgi:hypothetical protein